jgi:hypothetical protein
MIEPVQIKLIHIAKSKLGLDDEAYRAMLWGEFRVESSKSLSYAQAHQLIERFKTMGFSVVPKYRTPDRGNFRSRAPRRAPLPANVIRIISVDQAEMIEALAGKIVWKFADGYLRWLKKYMKIDRVKTAGQASDVIEGLKKLLDHQRGNDGCRKTG